jgi:TIR domain
VAFDAFISYASQDKTVADAVCARLESAGIRCWIAPRDIVPGMSYGEAIIDAIHAARVMILVFSSHANASGQVPKEVERAVSNSVPIIPFRIEDVAPGKSLDYFIGSVHWLDAMTPPMEQHLDSLAATVRKLVPEGDRDAAPQPRPLQENFPSNFAGAAPQPTPVISPRAAVPAAEKPSAGIPKMFWIGIAALSVALAGFALLHKSGGSDNAVAPDHTNPSPANGGDSTPAADNATPTPVKKSPAEHKAAPSPGVPVQGGDPIVGCWLLNNAAPYSVHADGSIKSGIFTGHWRSAGGDRYTFSWPEMIETLVVSPDQRSMSGGNQYGFPITGVRTGGTAGLAGTWHWANGWDVSVSPAGTFRSGNWSGTWHVADPARGIYEMTWPKPVDQVLLLGGGTRISASNQYGFSSGSVKTPNCSN